MSVPVLAARAVSKRFPVPGLGRGSGAVHALEPLDLQLYPGRITALVGESGSGKSTLARVLAMVYAPSGGEVQLDGKAVRPTRRTRPKRRYYRQVQMVFQDPFASLNPTRRVRYILGRPLRLHGHVRNRRELEPAIRRLLEQVNLTPADQFIDKHPHELSGGQRQRVAIARALAARPRVLLGDEPVSMLDVSIRLDLLNLLAKLRDEEELAILYITHDIASARYFADEVHVLYAGQLVEGGPSELVTQQPKHPYTRLLLDAAPGPDRPDDADDVAPGEPPSLVTPPTGCRFHPRCPLARPICAERFPQRTEFPDGQWAHCWEYAR